MTVLETETCGAVDGACRSAFVAAPDLPEEARQRRISHMAPEGSMVYRFPVKASGEGVVSVAAFDFDGTCIQGDSPVMLVRYLLKHGLMSKKAAFRILLWAGRYKFRLPQNESLARELVFSAFEGQPKAKVDAFLADFYHKVVEPRWRPEAAEAIERHAEAGHAVVMISASFEPIVREAMRNHCIYAQVSTRMQVDGSGCYTNKVDGAPVQGCEKALAITRLCDELFGPDKWELDWAYGDHHSDRALLSQAREPLAVTPDKPLKRTAKADGWEILDWNIEK
mgnify:CR=1 FL=1